jgi:hypothetical protein
MKKYRVKKFKLGYKVMEKVDGVWVDAPFWSLGREFSQTVCDSLNYMSK